MTFSTNDVVAWARVFDPGPDAMLALLSIAATGSLQSAYQLSGMPLGQFFEGLSMFAFDCSPRDEFIINQETCETDVPDAMLKPAEPVLDFLTELFLNGDGTYKKVTASSLGMEPTSDNAARHHKRISEAYSEIGRELELD